MPNNTAMHSTSSGTLTAGSLFTGIGGFDLGMNHAGVQVAWMCETDKACQSVLRRHWQEVPIHGDIRDLRASDVIHPDILMGGFPCQDVSVAGRRAGLDGERSGLWFEFRRIVGDLRPRWVVVENVPGLLSSNGGRDFAVILRGLVECGYGVAWRVLDAQFFGVPQRRRRVFIVGSLGDGRAAQVLFERESLPGDTPPRRETGARVARALAASSVSSGYRYDPNGKEYVVAPTLTRGAAGTKSHNKQNGSDRGALVITHTLRTPGAQASEDGTGRGVPLVIDGRNGTLQNDIATTLQACGLGDGRGGNPNATPLIATFGPRNVTSAANRTRVEPGLPANTLHQGGLSVIHHGVRRLTPRECERLMGFPDDWTAIQSDSARYRQLGNAVAVPVAEWIARRIVAVESEAA